MSLAPARLKLMITLTAVSEAEFSTVRDALNVSDSVLSKHLAALESVNYVKRRKGVHRGRRTTWISLTPRGKRRSRRTSPHSANSSGTWPSVHPRRSGVRVRASGSSGAWFRRTPCEAPVYLDTSQRRQRGEIDASANLDLRDRLARVGQC